MKSSKYTDGKIMILLNFMGSKLDRTYRDQDIVFESSLCLERSERQIVCSSSATLL